MPVKTVRDATLSEYLAEVLKNSAYEPGDKLDVVVAEAPDLPGCLTQGNSFEEARQNLIDAIEVWLMSGLRSGGRPAGRQRSETGDHGCPQEEAAACLTSPRCRDGNSCGNSRPWALRDRFPEASTNGCGATICGSPFPIPMQETSTPD